MNMKRIIIKAAATVIAALQIFAFASCGFIEDIIDGLETLDVDSLVSELGGEGTTSPEGKDTDAPDTTAEAAGGIPFSGTPEVNRYTLPAENYADELEREASNIIDDSIEKAIAAVLAMKDGRHADTTYPFEEDPNGLIAALTPTERKLYYEIIEKGENFETFSFSASEYGDALKNAWFALMDPLEEYNPGIACYLDIRPNTVIRGDDFETFYTSLYSLYFDPYKDQNTTTENAGVTMSEIEHAAKLLDRIVSRVVRFMPDGLSAYDKYYYLAAVLTTRVKYDKNELNAFNAFGALVGGRAVCEGYSEAYFLLCKKANLWCAYRSGIVEGQGHEWNMVKLDSGIYNVDVTWCDVGRPFERDFYDCFMKTDAEIADGREPHTGPASTGTGEPNPYEEQ